jgi:sec-independent protein translocase protein TatB
MAKRLDAASRTGRSGPWMVCCERMFGMGGSEILVILIVALLFLGPEKLPQAAKQISKGIRDIKKQSRALQDQIENDEQIGGAIRDLKSALRGEDLPVKPKPLKKKPPALPPADDGAKTALAGIAAAPEPPRNLGEAVTSDPVIEPKVTLPATAGEAGAWRPKATMTWRR